MADSPRWATISFWLCLFLVAYTYFLYPLLLFLFYAAAQLRRDWLYLMGRRNRRVSSPADLPGVSLVIPAYNEQGGLPEKLENLRQLDYPAEKFEVLFVSDGSTDGTNALLRQARDPWLQVVFLPERKGKAGALNEGVARARHDVLVFSDAATIFAADALTKLVRHFADPRVGIVCGALQFRGSDEALATEGLYWKYESMLRVMESRLGATLTASGAIYALRRGCYRRLEVDDWIEDFQIPMRARRRGYRVVYDPEAVAWERAAPTVAGEFARRVRLATGSYRAVAELARLPFFSFAFWAFVSHKLLRWMLPFLLVGLLVSNACLWQEPAYRAALVIQLCFYLWAGLGFVFRRQMQRVRFGLVGYFLVAIHLAFLVGFWRFLSGRGGSTWQRVH